MDNHKTTTEAPYHIRGGFIHREIGGTPRRFEMSLLFYPTSNQSYYDALHWAKAEKNKVLTAYHDGQRFYCVETYIEGDSQGGVLMAIYEQVQIDTGACCRGECDPLWTHHYVNGSLLSSEVFYAILAKEPLYLFLLQCEAEAARELEAAAGDIHTTWYLLHSRAKEALRITRSIHHWHFSDLVEVGHQGVRRSIRSVLKEVYEDVYGRAQCKANGEASCNIMARWCEQAKAAIDQSAE